VYQSLWKKAVPPAFASLDLTQLWNTPRDKMDPQLCDFLRYVVWPPTLPVRAYPVVMMTAAEVEAAMQQTVTATVNAAVGPAVHAAVHAAVNAAVGPAVHAAVTAASAGTSAALRNFRLQKRNGVALDTHNVQSQLNPLVKEVEGDGQGLPGHLHPATAVPHPIPVGQPMPSPPFPGNIEDLDSLTHANLSVLSMLYNDDFGIGASDELVVRRAKFRAWIRGL